MTLLIWWREPGTAEERHKMAEQDERSPLAQVLGEVLSRVKLTNSR